ncbi:endonuclease III domain-containing protein [Candidatus Omnitrophota bacterium]
MAKRAQNTKAKNGINKIYDLLEGYFGDLGWWPAESDFEVIVGAVLTQNTAWSNVTKAIKELKGKNLLDPAKIERIDLARLARVIRSAGYYRIKARRLKEISRFVMAECGGKLARLKRQDARKLREKLLAVNGVGPETADSILIYALGKPVFVVDAYTKRIFSRHGLTSENASYEEVQSLAQRYLPSDGKVLNQFHALLVETGKRFCRKKAGQCSECPLKGL